MQESIVPIVPFLEELFYLPEGKPIKLEPHQRVVLERAFTPDSSGRLPYSTVIYSAPKKSGKSTVASAIITWFAFSGIAEPNDEIIVAANTRQQAKNRVFQGIIHALRKSPLREELAAEPTADLITTKRGVTIQVIPTEYTGAAGSNHSIVSFDELWGLTSERDQRFYEELTPVPTRKNSLRLITTYAGVVGESTLLLNLYEHAMAGTRLPGESLPIWVNRKVGLFCYWDHEHRMPWQKTQDFRRYLAEQKKTLRPQTYDRLHRNLWSTTETGIDMELWGACVDPDYSPPDYGKDIFLGIGIDASYKKDLTAVVSCFKREGKLYLGPWKTWQPRVGESFDLEKTVEEFILDLQRRYSIHAVYYDPYQFHRSAQILRARGVRMKEYTQTEPHAREMGNRLMDLLRYRNLVLTDSVELKVQAELVQLKEQTEGVLIKKRDKNHKIDAIIALAMACLAADDAPDATRELTNSIMVLRRPAFPALGRQAFSDALRARL